MSADHVILHGDCRDALATIAEGSIAACVTSPPYYSGQSYLPAGHPDRGREIGGEKSPSEYIDNLVEAFAEVRHPLREDGFLWVVLGDTVGIDGEPLGMPWLVANALRYDGWCLFSEEVVAHADRPHDTLFLFGRPGSPFEPRRGGSTVLQGRDDEVEGALFGVMPSWVALRCIGLSTARGDTVLDPFAGSGTVAVAAKLSGRRSVSIETDPRSVWLAQSRIA